MLQSSVNDVECPMEQLIQRTGDQDELETNLFGGTVGTQEIAVLWPFAHIHLSHDLQCHRKLSPHPL